MKNSVVISLVILCGIAVWAQKIQHEAIAVNIEVPVRVFKGDTFIDSLTIDDFELSEDGVLQTIDAVYLIKKTAIERKDGGRQFSPQTARNFYLFFEISEFTAKLNEALGYFFDNVLLPGDSLTIVTPRKTYQMKSETLKVLPKAEISRQLKEKIRGDAWLGNSEYRSAFLDLEGLVRSLAGSSGGASGGSQVEGARGTNFEGMELDEKLQYLDPLLAKLDGLRKIEQKRLLDFADYLKDISGQKIVFLFYQREFVPQLEPSIINAIVSSNQDQPQIQMMLASFTEFHRRDISFDVNLVKQAYADSSIAIHFLYFTKQPENIPGIVMVERSEDIFSAFNEMAVATGGLATSSSNPEFLFQKASDASENYYLVYYTPKNYQTDGKFKQIDVRVKTGNYRVTHRAGYFAD